MLLKSQLTTARLTKPALSNAVRVIKTFSVLSIGYVSIAEMLLVNVHRKQVSEAAKKKKSKSTFNQY